MISVLVVAFIFMVFLEQAKYSPLPLLNNFFSYSNFADIIVVEAYLNRRLTYLVCLFQIKLQTMSVLAVMRNIKAEVDAGSIRPYCFVEVNGLKLASPENIYRVI